MNNPSPLTAKDGEGIRRRRRFPWLTSDDMKVLEALSPEAADEFEHFVREQASRDAAFRRNVILESDFAPNQGALEVAHGERAARWQHGCGGGRANPRVTPETDLPRAA